MHKNSELHITKFEKSTQPKKKTHQRNTDQSTEFKPYRLREFNLSPRCFTFSQSFKKHQHY